MVTNANASVMDHSSHEVDVPVVHKSSYVPHSSEGDRLG